jgi:hypothetical protein
VTAATISSNSRMADRMTRAIPVHSGDTLRLRHGADGVGANP